MSGQNAALVTYETKRDRFDSRSERNKFYRGLFGYKRTVRRNDTVYKYDKDGLLDAVPHIKVADSVFLVKREDLNKFRQYFDRWSGKIETDLYRIKLENRRIR